MNNLFDTIWQQVQTLNNRVDQFAQKLNAYTPSAGNGEVDEDVIASLNNLQNNISTINSTLSQIQSNINALNTTSGTLLQEAESINADIVALHENLSKYDNELYFIIRGTYITEDDLLEILDGEY